MVSPATARAPRLHIAVPQTWYRMDIATDPEGEIDRVARDMTRALPRDSAAAARHKFAQTLRDIVGSATEDAGAKAEMLAFPSNRGLSSGLPVTLTVGRLPEPGDGSARVAEVMHALAQRDSSATPLVVADTMAIRTHSLNDVGEQIVETVADMTDGPEEGADASIEAANLRARYVIGWQGENPSWHFVVGTALVPGGEGQDAIVDEYLDLFDTMVSTIAREVPEAPK